MRGIIVVHRSARLREAAGTALREAGLGVISAESAAAVSALIPLRDTRALALVEHVFGCPTTRWNRVRRLLPRGTPVVGMVEVIGPGDTIEVVLVTRGEREVVGPIPLADLPLAIGRISPAGSRARKLEVRA